jgi:hypothetical protein
MEALLGGLTTIPEAIARSQSIPIVMHRAAGGWWWWWFEVVCCV